MIDMAFDPFIGWTQVDLEAELRTAQMDLAAGSQVVSVGGGDSNVSAMQQVSIIQRIEALYKKLWEFDPVTYDPAKIKTLTRTVADLST